MTVTVEPSDEDDRSHLQLSEVEPVGVMAGIYFLDDGTPFEVGTMRVHYSTCDITVSSVWTANNPKFTNCLTFGRKKRLYQALQLKNKQSTKIDRTNFVLFILPIFEIYYSICNPEITSAIEPFSKL